MPEAASPTMTAVRDVDGKFRKVELQWISMSDGRRLAARLWIPNEADSAPVPAF
jgi:predicted acyl esterase